MFEVTKRLEISGSHRLDLPYESKCTNVHGHNWIVCVTCQSKVLSSYGMVVDFTTIKKLIHNKLDHKHLNDILTINPTAENLCQWIGSTINEYLKTDAAECVKVSIQESEGNVASWRKY